MIPAQLETVRNLTVAGLSLTNTRLKPGGLEPRSAATVSTVSSAGWAIERKGGPSFG
jgi:hypothetical protein